MNGPRRAMLVAALAAIAVVACSGGSSSHSAGVSSPSAAGSTLSVTASEYTFDPSTLTTSAGTVTFEVTNSGNEEHEFEIFQGETVVDEVEGLLPGITNELRVDLAAGDYIYVCKLPGHEEAGMKGTLTVTS
ncbi:MAG TPA: cupredoxin domain-containing protein [Candidatus Limnocylindrales bacterium]|jgi:iron uptake system component EfeO